MCGKNRRKHRFCDSKEVRTRFLTRKNVENIDFAVFERYHIMVSTLKMVRTTLYINLLEKAILDEVKIREDEQSNKDILKLFNPEAGYKGITEYDVQPSSVYLM